MNKELLTYFLSFIKLDRIDRLFKAGFFLMSENDIYSIYKRIELCDQAVKDGYLIKDDKKSNKEQRWYRLTEESKNILLALVKL